MASSEGLGAVFFESGALGVGSGVDFLAVAFFVTLATGLVADAVFAGAFFAVFATAFLAITFFATVF